MSTIPVAVDTPATSMQRSMRQYSQKVTASLEVSKPKNHLFVLDGARAIACLAVLLHHIAIYVIFPSGSWVGLWKPTGLIQTFLAAALDFGGLATILFFLLSSFLLFLPFAKALLFDGQWPSVSRFYIRRCFRIIPGYYAAVFLMILLFHPEFLDAAHRWRLLEFLTFTMNGGLSAQLNGPFWTMAIEFQYYMILPLLAWIISLIVLRGTLYWRLTKLVGCLLGVLGWGLLSRWLGLFLNPSGKGFIHTTLLALQPYYYSDTGKFFEAFAVGMLLAVLYVYTQNALHGDLLRAKLERWSPWIFLAGLVLLGFLTIWHFYSGAWSNFRAFAFLAPYTYLVTSMFSQWHPVGYSIGYGLCMCALLYNTGRLKRPFEWPVLRWIGLFSFSLYMWHYPLLFVFIGMLNTQFQGVPHIILLLALFAWVFFVIFPISLTLYRWIEMPGMRLGELFLRWIEKQKKKQSAIHIPTAEVISKPVEVEVF